MLPTSRADATQSLRASPRPEHVNFVSSQSAEDGETISMTSRIWRPVWCEGATEADDDSIVCVDIEGEDAESSARPQPEARTRVASNHNSR
jgi:hypothetical protein